MTVVGLSWNFNGTTDTYVRDPALDVTTITWIGTGSASNANNWSSFKVPTTGDNVIFDHAVSDGNCNWDVAVTLGTFTMGTGYAGVVTLGADVGCTDFLMQAGTFTGSTSYTLTCAGDFAQSGGSVTTKTVNLILSGNAKSLSFASTNYFNTLTFNGNTNVITTTRTLSLDIKNGIMVDVATTKVLVITYYIGSTYSNLGTIGGAGQFQIYISDEDKSISFGTINCPTTLLSGAASTDNRILTLSSDIIINSLNITSGHATYTVALNLAGYTLTCTTLTIGVRGILTASVAGSAITASGGIVVDDNGTFISTNIDTINTISCTGVGSYTGTATTALTITAGTTSIAAYAFADKVMFTLVTIPISVTTIGNYAFTSCTSLTSVTIGRGVTTIGDRVFWLCEHLTSITFRGLVAPTSVGGDWLLSTPNELRGHAHSMSNFPAPASTFYGLTMGDVVKPVMSNFANGNLTVAGIITGSAYIANTSVGMTGTRIVTLNTGTALMTIVGGIIISIV